MRVKFLTKPQDPPSGVSAGQTMPQCELCSCLGFGYLPFLSNGVVTLLKWDKNDANVSLFSTCDTPVFKTLLSLSLGTVWHFWTALAVGIAYLESCRLVL